MKKIFKLRVIVVVLIAVLGINTAKAQENNNQVDVSIGADVVSGYIWRGEDCGGVSIQPSISVAKSGFSLTAWGSVGLESSDTKELDLTLGYETGGFSIGITDYWFDRDDEKKTRYFKYGAHSTAHIFEATVAYDFGPVALNWNTYFAGADYTKENGNRAYSSYAEAIVPFKLGGFDFAAEVGLTPWEGAYSSGFNVVNISLGTSKEIKITYAYSLQAFAKLTFNPNQDKTYFAFGVSF
ncbi:hypothetical protein [Bacteroides sp. 519]|uniref:hypothetical protein n=1 Tax=Bacteroides sp. 519 TaxID=2302937 RepID=UPI0013CFB994|nr:hypothetical protein [Bacteroides sp. 519]NDV60075.1 hypothetical protein [Bacteroides sp. 519]